MQLAYAIGVADPVGIFVETYGTSNLSQMALSELIRANFGLKPAQLIEDLKLLQPIYKETAAYGHFGRSEFPWESLDKVTALKQHS